MKIRIHRFLAGSRVDGPGKRACLFVQGCSIRCEGCAVPWTWDEEGGETVDAGQIIEAIRKGPKVDGVTFLGGEPFDQAAALCEIAREIKKDGLSVVTFTGREIEHIKNSEEPDWLELLELTDLLIDGPFIVEKKDASRPWVGSSNQKYYFLTPRLREYESRLKDIKNRLEIRMLPNGVVSVNGLILTDDLRSFVNNMIN